MPHIHTKPGQIDFISEVYIVYKNKVLIRLHDKIKQWIAPGGHIELDEVPEETAVREAKEETGLDVTLYRGDELMIEKDETYHSLIKPIFMNIHRVNGVEGHRHLSLIYFGTADTDIIVQPENEEKTQCRWMTKEEVVAADDLNPIIKNYALKALALLAS